MSDLTPDDIALILDTAESFKEVNERRIKKLPTLRGRTVVNLFLEPSARARARASRSPPSASRPTAINFTGSASATVKGESLRDTAETLSAMACDLVIVRHKYAGAPQMLAEHMDAHIINGGDGMHEHPTQALLDLFTMRERLGQLEGLTVGIVGDICHSRVAGSLVPALQDGRRDARSSSRRRRCCRRGPTSSAPRSRTSLDEVLPELDVAYMLRIQMERAEGMPFPSLREYATLFGMNAARLAR